jgi:hypothetical protein
MHQVDLVRIDMRQAARVALHLQVIEEATRALDRHDAPERPDEFGEVKRGEAGARAHIEHARARADACRKPRLANAWPPQIVLECQPSKLGVVRSKHIVAF